MIKTSAKVLNQLKTVKSFAGLCSLLMSFLSTLFVFSSLSFADPNIASSSNSVTCNDTTLETYSGTSNLSANWGANTINLHWYADSESTTELTVPTTSQSCVYDSTLTPPPVSSVPQRTGYTFIGWKVRGLPEGYTKLQYIQSTGTQWINTGMALNTATDDIELVFEADSYTSGNSLFGARASTTSNVYSFAISSSLKYRVGWGASSPTLDIDADTNKHTLKIEHNGGVFKLDGVTIATRGNTSIVTPTTAGLFAIHATSSTKVYYGRTKIYEYKMLRNGKLTQHMIPAKNSNNVAGMWDTVTKTFFTNAGSGSFTAGPVVQ